MSQEMPSAPLSQRNDVLGDPALRKSVRDFVRRRVPPSDVDDVVQTVFCDALAAPSRPPEPAELKRWLLGIARHKAADRHRRTLRELPADLSEIETGPAPIETREMVRWAEEQVGEAPDAKKTLDWMAREGEGEKLKAIAADERLPAARVRQRVSRMRRALKERWAAELAAVAMLAALALLAWWLLRDRGDPPVAHDLPDVAPTIVPELPSPVDRARSLRAEALRACDQRDWSACLDGLDQARGLDPTGDQDPAVGAARATARQNLRPVAPEQDQAVPLTKGSVAAPIRQKASPKVSKPSKSKSAEDVTEPGEPSLTPKASAPPAGTASGAFGSKNPSGVKKRATPTFE
jgi:DNA-directed RNA polymerase specialized sigma24 family protein